MRRWLQQPSSSSKGHRATLLAQVLRPRQHHPAKRVASTHEAQASCALQEAQSWLPTASGVALKAWSAWDQPRGEGT